MRTLLALFLAAALAPASTEAIRAGLRSDSRGAREIAERAARRLARLDPGGLGDLWRELAPRGRCGLLRALASAGTRHAALVALQHADDSSPMVFRCLLTGLAGGGRAALFAELPEGLAPERNKAIEALRLRWKVEAELARIKSPDGATGSFTGQFSRLGPLGPAILPILIDIVNDRAVPLLGEGSSGPFRRIHPGMVRYDGRELRELVAHSFGEVVERGDKKTLALLRAMWDRYWGMDEIEYDFEHNSLAPALAYSLFDLGLNEPVQTYIRELRSRWARGGFDGLRAKWSLGYANIRIGNYAEGERHYQDILDSRDGSVSRDVAAYNLACNFSLRAQRDPKRRKLYLQLALRYLEKAVYELNWWDWGWLQRDGDLRFLHDQPRYRKALDYLRRKWPERRRQAKVSKNLKDFLGGK